MYARRMPVRHSIYGAPINRDAVAYDAGVLSSAMPRARSIRRGEATGGRAYGDAVGCCVARCANICDTGRAELLRRRIVPSEQRTVTARGRQAHSVDARSEDRLRISR